MPSLTLPIYYISFHVPAFHLLLFALFRAPGLWLGVAGVRTLGLKTSETHRPEGVVKTGVYSKVRHPQYLGGLLSHVGISFLLSAWYSLLSTPLLVAVILAISKKEEAELIKEFGDEYKRYMKEVPMFIPRF